MSIGSKLMGHPLVLVIAGTEMALSCGSFLNTDEQILIANGAGDKETRRQGTDITLGLSISLT